MRKHYSPSFLTITVSFIILWITTEILSYISNQGASFIFFTTVGWVLTYVLTIAYAKTVEVLSLFIVVDRLLTYAILLFPLAPILYILSSIRGLQWFFIGREMMKMLFVTNIICIIWTIAEICLPLYSKKFNRALAHLTRSATEPSASSSNTLLSEPEHLLGQGNTGIDRVIKSLFYRANRSEKTAKLSLAVIVLLVYVGGSISIGTIALDQFSKLRQLEKVRQEMLLVVDKLDSRMLKYGYKGPKDSIEIITLKHDSTIAKEIQQSITTTFGSLEDTKSFKELLENIQKKESYNISEIVMRVAIAALTFFLVQVFLRIHKYNQQQSTSLLTKAEVLELFNEPGTDMKKLREILASKIEEDPKFGNPPSTPIEQIINMVDKAKSNGTHS